jgi:hypothetical protein
MRLGELSGKGSRGKIKILCEDKTTGCAPPEERQRLKMRAMDGLKMREWVRGRHLHILCGVYVY